MRSLHYVRDDECCWRRFAFVIASTAKKQRHCKRSEAISRSNVKALPLKTLAPWRHFSRVVQWARKLLLSVLLRQNKKTNRRAFHLTIRTGKAAMPLVHNLIKVAGLALLLQSATLAAAVDAKQSTSEATMKALLAETGDAANRQRLPKDGGAPAVVLRAYLSAMQARDWNAMQAVSPDEIRELMEEDEADGVHLELLDGMRKRAPAKIDIIEGWIVEDAVAFVSYQGHGADRGRKGIAQLVIENGKWKLTVLGL
jgi:hypothetical protein